MKQLLGFGMALTALIAFNVSAFADHEGTPHHKGHHHHHHKHHPKSSNKGGAVRGEERAEQVQEMNKGKVAPGIEKNEAKKGTEEKEPSNQ